MTLSRILCVVLSLLAPAAVLSQTTIRTGDLEYHVGGYYQMYDVPSPQGVIGRTGITGGPHSFDFSTGVTIRPLRFDYVETSDGGHGGDFPTAAVAERKTDGADQAWLYLTFDQATGRIVHGFYDAVGVPESPSVPFTPAVVDFPDSISYGSWFTGSTSFNVISSGIELVVDYSFSAFVDAFGTIILPDSAGTFDCIQVNYSEEYVYLWMGVPMQSSYLRSYYYLTKEAGISTIITSQESGTAVPNDFSIAAAFARLYDSSKLAAAPPAPLNVAITKLDGEVTLTWDPGTERRDVTYNVYSSSDPYAPFVSGTWTIEASGIVTTTWTDEGVSEEQKFYRVTAED